MITADEVRLLVPGIGYDDLAKKVEDRIKTTAARHLTSCGVFEADVAGLHRWLVSDGGSPILDKLCAELAKAGFKIEKVRNTDPRDPRDQPYLRVSW